MKKNYPLIVIFFLLFAPSSFGQRIIDCGTKLSHKEEIVFKQSLSKIETARKVGLRLKKASGPYIIPVVFHILNNGGIVTKESMKYGIDDTLLTVNKDFNSLYSYFKNVSPLFERVKSKMDIQFVEATVDPDGNLLETPGMDWHADAHVDYGYYPQIFEYIWWDKNGKFYSDIVIVDQPNGIGNTNGFGHAFLPVQETIPCVTYNWRYIGNAAARGSYSGPNFEKVMTHEFGHYFGLKHVFEKGYNPINDGMADTPPTTQAFGCNLNAVNSCGVIANYENHVDYNVECQKMYTKYQIIAMTYWLDDLTVAKCPRGLLWQTSNLSSVGVIATAPIAKFSSNTTSICVGKSVIFKDVTLGLPTARTWTFEGGAPATSTASNPRVGKYKVTILVSNSLGDNAKEVVNYIEVGQKSMADLSENFIGIFPQTGLSVTNPDDGLTWEKRTGTGHGDQTCMVMNNADNSVIGALDYIRLPFLDLSSGSKSQIARLVSVSNVSPVAKISTKTGLESSCNTLTTQFYGDQSYDVDDTNLVYLWNCGDGSTSTEINPSHIFLVNDNSPTSREVSLSVTDDSKNSSVVIKKFI